MSGRRRAVRPRPEEDPRLRDEPGWLPLVELARAQAGVFLQKQAVECGMDLAALRLLAQSGRIYRLQPTLFRLERDPEPLEPLVLLWLWTGRHGVFSHRTALVLHGLLPLDEAEDVHLTVPMLWPGRCRSVPARLSLHGEDLPEEEIVRICAFPVICVERALQHGLPGLPRLDVRRIVREAVRRGLLDDPEEPATASDPA